MVGVMFLFYSGYGKIESILKRGLNYIKSFPKKRLLTVYINFIIAVLLFLIANLMIGNILDLKRVVLAFVAYTSIGNSNWYMFVVFALYIFTCVPYNI